MQRNDLEQVTVSRSVVVLRPTLAIPTKTQTTPALGRRRRRLKTIESHQINRGMVIWMLNHSYQTNEGFEVWGFEEEWLFDALVAELLAYVDHCVVAWERFATEQLAKDRVMTSPEIRTVYDANHGRVDRLWKFKGFRVPVGRTP